MSELNPANENISDFEQNAYCRDTKTWMMCLEEIAAEAKENEREREKRRQERRLIVEHEEAFWASIGGKSHAAN